MSENRCERCNRKLKDPIAQYGWKCAEILGAAKVLNRAGDNAFDAYIAGIENVNGFLRKNHIDKKNINLAKFYDAMTKRTIAASIRNEKLWEAANREVEAVLKNKSVSSTIPLLEYVALKDKNDFSKGRFTTNTYLDKNFNKNIASFQRRLDKNGFTDKFGNKLKFDGLLGPRTQLANDAYYWEKANQGIFLAKGKPNFVPRKDKRHGSEDRQPTGDRERNIGHPDGEEHSRVNKGPKGKARGSKGPMRSDAIENIGKGVIATSAVVGFGYLIYRGVRMLPSLLPVLWWTIPANLAIP